jgi:hypothetical protein
MTQATIDPASVPMATQKTKRTLRTAVKKTEPKKVRKDGTVKTTLLLDVWIDDQLAALAFAWKTDRSELARQFIAAKLRTYNVDEELKRFVVPTPPKPADTDPAKSDDEVNRPKDTEENN